MSTFLFWCVVIVLTLILGALLPKILLFLIRVALYVAAFFLILWGLARIGLVPLPYQERLHSLFQHEKPPKAQESFANFQ